VRESHNQAMKQEMAILMEKINTLVEQQNTNIGHIDSLRKNLEEL
jgi:hypothetical protein